MLCYALAKNGLSFALGTGASEDDGVEVDPALDTWARTTQLIMLNEKADLVGGLMDFDVIISSCAYDGITIYATPRAAFSLKSVVQVVTPFVFEARGNRRRTTKGLVLNSTTREDLTPSSSIHFAFTKSSVSKTRKQILMVPRTLKLSIGKFSIDRIS
jgi:hypothetical protein